MCILRHSRATPSAPRRLTVEWKPDVFDTLPLGQPLSEAELMRITGLSVYALSLALRGLSGHNLVFRDRGPNSDTPFAWSRAF